MVALLFGGAAMVACSAPSRVFCVLLDVRFSALQTEKLLHALDDWREITCGRLAYTVGIVDTAQVDRVENQIVISPGVMRYENEGGHTSRHPESEGSADVWLPLDGSAERFQRNAAHELGHAFGLKHVTGYPSIMNPVSSDVLGPLPVDAEAFFAIYGRV